MPLARVPRADVDQEFEAPRPECRVLAEMTASGCRHIRDAISMDRWTVMGFMARAALG